MWERHRMKIEVVSHAHHSNGNTAEHVNSLQLGSNLDSGQGNTMNSLQQVVVGSLPQSSVTAFPLANINTLSSQSGVNVLQSNINLLQSNSNMLQHQNLKHQGQQMLQSQQLKQREEELAKAASASLAEAAAKDVSPENALDRADIPDSDDEEEVEVV
ncbi:hypothetical protein ACOSQ2_005425 [Xanthoceras sorbifolium]